jgi:hypothetical protein
VHREELLLNQASAVSGVVLALAADHLDDAGSNEPVERVSGGGHGQADAVGDGLGADRRVSGSGTGGIGIQSCHHGWAVPGDRPQHVLIGCTTARLIVLSGLSGLFRYRRGLR